MQKFSVRERRRKISFIKICTSFSVDPSGKIPSLKNAKVFPSGSLSGKFHHLKIQSFFRTTLRKMSPDQKIFCKKKLSSRRCAKKFRHRPKKFLTKKFPSGRRAGKFSVIVVTIRNNTCWLVHRVGMTARRIPTNVRSSVVVYVQYVDTFPEPDAQMFFEQTRRRYGRKESPARSRPARWCASLRGMVRPFCHSMPVSESQPGGRPDGAVVTRKTRRRSR